MSTLPVPDYLSGAADVPSSVGLVSRIKYAADGAGYVPEGVAVLSPRLAPPGPGDAPDAPAPCAVRWGVPPCEGVP